MKQSFSVTFSSHSLTVIMRQPKTLYHNALTLNRNTIIHLEAWDFYIGQCLNRLPVDNTWSVHSVPDYSMMMMSVCVRACEKTSRFNRRSGIPETHFHIHCHVWFQLHVIWWIYLKRSSFIIEWGSVTALLNIRWILLYHVLYPPSSASNASNYTISLCFHDLIQALAE